MQLVEQLPKDWVMAFADEIRNAPLVLVDGGFTYHDVYRLD